jgi:hypothetical protein
LAIGAVHLFRDLRPHLCGLHHRLPRARKVILPSSPRLTQRWLSGTLFGGLLVSFPNIPETFRYVYYFSVTAVTQRALIVNDMDCCYLTVTCDTLENKEGFATSASTNTSSFCANMAEEGNLGRYTLEVSLPLLVHSLTSLPVYLSLSVSALFHRQSLASVARQYLSDGVSRVLGLVECHLSGRRRRDPHDERLLCLSPSPHRRRLPLKGWAQFEGSHSTLA